MRTILLLGNFILAAFVAFHAYEWLNEPSVEAEVATTVTRERRTSAPQPQPVATQQMFPQYGYGFNPTPMSTENQVATTVALNIFDPERAPKAATNNRTVATPVNRNDMTLVGTFTIGRIAGAIILQRGMQMQNMMRQQPGRNNNNRNGNTNTAEELAAAQEQQMQQALENREELTSLLQALQQSPGVTAQQTELLRQRLARSNEQIELLQNQNQQRNTGRDGLSAEGITAANASNSNKQYFRIGETLPNGYTLAAVTRSTATLTRNQEQIELTMQNSTGNAGMGGFGMGSMGGFGGMGGFGMGGMGGFGGMDMGFGGGMGGFGGGMDFGGGMGGFGGGMGGFGGGGAGGMGGFGGGAGGMGGFGGGAGGMGGFGGGAGGMGGFGGGMGGFGGF